MFILICDVSITGRLEAILIGDVSDFNQLTIGGGVAVFSLLNDACTFLVTGCLTRGWINDWNFEGLQRTSCLLFDAISSLESVLEVAFAIQAL